MTYFQYLNPFKNRKRYLLFAIIVSMILGCGPTIYKAQDFTSITSTHKVVAILPASVNIRLRPSKMKKMTDVQLKELEEQTGIDIQHKLYSWFLKNNDKLKYSVSFLDVDKGNDLIKQSGIGYAEMLKKNKQELANLLGVDAIISVEAIMRQPMNGGLATADFLLGGNMNKTNDVATVISIHEAKQGELIWTYEHTVSGSVGTNLDKLVDILMQKASKRFPYSNK